MAYGCSKDNNGEDEKEKSTKKCVITPPLNFKILKTV